MDGTMSTPAKHTAGPWIRQPRDEDGAIWIVGSNLGGLVGAALPWPTEIDSDDFSRVEANGCMIGAAPTMFDALAELKFAIEDGLCNSGTPGFDSGRLDRAITAADAAIALATPVLGREG